MFFIVIEELRLHMMGYFKKWDVSLLDKAIPLDSMLYRYRRHMSHYKKLMSGMLPMIKSIALVQ